MLTNKGFVPKKTPQLKIELDTRLLEIFGPVNLNAETVFGQFVGLTVDQQAELWAQMEELYWSQYPSSAVGINLDRVASLNGLTRLAARPTAARGVVSGTIGTVLAIGRIARATDGEYYNLIDAVTLSATQSVGSTLFVNNVQNSTNYTITLGGVGYTYNSGLAATAASILNGLEALLPIWVRTELSTGIEGNNLRMEYDTPMTVLVSANLGISSVSNYANFQAQNGGPIALPVGSLVEITTPVSGWNSVTNRTEGSLGRDIETDDEFRLRRSNSLRLAGTNTMDAIVSHLSQVPGVIAQRVTVNNTNSTNVDGVPGHSIWAIVDGGTDQEVARVLYNNVAAGIGYHGSEEIDVVSPVTLQSFEVKFDRPVNVPFWITVTIQQSNVTPTDVIERIRSALMLHAQGLEIAEPLLYTRLFSPINAVIGEGAYVTQLYTELNSSPDQTANIVPDPNERLVLAPDRIQVFALPPS